MLATPACHGATPHLRWSCGELCGGWDCGIGCSTRFRDFLGKKVAVQVDGCFWHGCPEHGTVPSRNSEWWQWKIAKNQARDRDTDEKLEALGWTVIHIWEHEDSGNAARLVAASITDSGEPATDHQ